MCSNFMFSMIALGRFMNRPYWVLMVALGLGVVQPALGQLVTSALYVGNQGNFSDANGTVSIYTPSSDMVMLDAVPNLNTLVQSITIHENIGYVIANTSDRIDVIDLSTNLRTGQITDVPGPRYMTIAGDDKALVSNLFNNSVSVLNLSTNAITGSIGVGNNPEDVAVIDNLAYVANNGFGFDSTLTVIDTSTDMAIDTIDLGCDGPRFLEVDGQDELWVICNGKTVYNSDFTEIVEQTNGQVVVINAQNHQIIERFELEAQLGSASAGQDSFHDPVNDRIFVVMGNKIVQFNTTTNERLDYMEVPGDELIGGVAYDAASDRLYISRITSFTTAGFVATYDWLTGMELSRFDAGIVPTTITLLQSGTAVSSEVMDYEVPNSFSVHQNYPNPFNPTTTISFENSRSTNIQIKIYDVLGAEIATLTDRLFEAGFHEMQWNASGLPSGTYWFKIQAENFAASKRMTMLK